MEKIDFRQQQKQFDNIRKQIKSNLIKKAYGCKTYEEALIYVNQWQGELWDQRSLISGNIRLLAKKIGDEVMSEIRKDALSQHLTKK